MKKIITLLMAAMLLASGIITVGAAAETPAAERSVEKLKGLGILSESYSVSGNMTRGEFAQILAALYNNTTVYYTGETYFADLEKETSRALVNAVNLLASYGVIKGYPGASFRPQEPLCIEDAEVALVRMLGYEYAAEEAGGYASGYIAVASKIGLTAGASSAKNVNGAVAVMIDNALDIKVLNRTDMGGDLTLEQGDETLMQSLLETETCRGVIYAAGKTAISDTYSVKNGYVRVGDRVFKADCDIKTVNALIGRTAEVYYREEDGEDVICYIRDMQKETVITAELGGDTVLENGTLTYYEGTRKRTAKISAAPYVVYNGRPSDRIPELGLSGTITCIGTSGSEYSILIIEDYKTHVVDRVYDGGSGIVSKYADTELPDLSEVEELYILDKDNNDMKLSDIAVNDVLSVMQSEDGEFMLIRISRRSFFGKLDSIDGDGAYKDYRLRISAMEYKVTPEFYRYLQDVPASALMLLTEDFYTDIFGRIAYADIQGTSAGQGTVGYLIRSYRDVDTEKSVMKVFDENGKFTRLVLSEKMKYNNIGKKVEGLDACDWFVDNVKAGQLIYYKTDRDGEVISVETAAARPCDGFYQMCSVSGMRYRSSQKCFGSKVIVRSDSIVFNVPSDAKDLFNEACYSIGTISGFVSGTRYSASFYTTQKDAYTADIVLYPQSFDGEAKNTVVMADKLLTTLNNDSDPVQRLYCWNVGGALTYFDAKDGVSLKKTNLALSGTTGGEVSIGRGDIIRYVINPNNEICSYYMIYSCENDTYYPNINPYVNGTSDEYRFGLGTPLGMDGTILKVQYRDTNEIEYFDVASSKVVIAERGGEINEGSISELMRKDIYAVFVYAPNNAPAIIYAYKN